MRLTAERVRWLLQQPDFEGLPEGTQIELVRMLVLHANALGAFYPSVRKATDPGRGKRQESGSTIRARFKRAVAAGVLHEFPWFRESGHRAPTVYVFALGRTKAEVAAELRAAGCQLVRGSYRATGRTLVLGAPTDRRTERIQNGLSVGTEAHGTAGAGHGAVRDLSTERQA
jgi:hypothetical protein